MGLAGGKKPKEEGEDWLGLAAALSFEKVAQCRLAVEAEERKLEGVEGNMN